MLLESIKRMIKPVTILTILNLLQASIPNTSGGLSCNSWGVKQILDQCAVLTLKEVVQEVVQNVDTVQHEVTDLLENSLEEATIIERILKAQWKLMEHLWDKQLSSSDKHLMNSLLTNLTNEIEATHKLIEIARNKTKIFEKELNQPVGITDFVDHRPSWAAMVALIISTATLVFMCCTKARAGINIIERR